MAGRFVNKEDGNNRNLPNPLTHKVFFGIFI